MTACLPPNINVFLSLTFLAHQMLLSLDAVVRTLVRRMVTRSGCWNGKPPPKQKLGTATRTCARQLSGLDAGAGDCDWSF